MNSDRLAEIRIEIDNLDEQIVKLLAKRRVFVEEAAKYKRNLADVSAPARVEEVIGKVTKMADQHGLAPSVVEQVYRTMIQSFIQVERAEFEKIVANEKRTTSKDG